MAFDFTLTEAYCKEYSENAPFRKACTLEMLGLTNTLEYALARAEMLGATVGIKKICMRARKEALKYK